MASEMKELNGQSSQQIGALDATGEQPVPTPLAADLRNAIDFEIGRIESEQKKPGWSSWALIASLVSSLWLLLDALGKGTVSLANIIVVIIGATFLMESAWALPHLVSPFGRAKPRFWRPRDILSNQRVPLLLLLGKAVALVWATHYVTWYLVIINHHQQHAIFVAMQHNNGILIDGFEIGGEVLGWNCVKHGDGPQDERSSRQLRFAHLPVGRLVVVQVQIQSPRYENYLLLHRPPFDLSLQGVHNARRHTLGPNVETALV